MDCAEAFCVQDGDQPVHQVVQRLYWRVVRRQHAKAVPQRENLREREFAYAQRAGQPHDGLGANSDASVAPGLTSMPALGDGVAGAELCQKGV